MRRPRFLLLPWIAVAVPAALLLGAPPAAAHPMPHSVVVLDVHETDVTAELRLPAGELATASGIDPTATPLRDEALRAYVEMHVKPTTLTGEPWTVTVGDLKLEATEQTATGPYQEIIAQATLKPPLGGDIRNFAFGYDVIVHQVVTHVALVSVRQDWAGGKLSETQVGTIKIDVKSMTVPTLTVDLGGGSAWRGFLAMVKLGGTHILTGTDHLLFLLVLLLPAALRFRRLAATTLAFTLGHSVALAVSTLGHLNIPAGPVEAFIAASILIGAINAIRPIFGGREPLVAGVFGLGHGLAFSFTLAELQLSTGRLALSLLGFNLGIELVQLLLVALALPTLIALAKSPAERRLRVTAATLTAIAATGWLLDRLGMPNFVARMADGAGTHPTAVLVGLAASAAMAGMWMRANFDLPRLSSRTRNRQASPGQF